MDSQTKILIADDMASTRQVLDMLLREADYATVMAKNGHEAVALFHTELPNLVILDVIMGGMDGYDVAKAIRSSVQGGNVPIIFLTVMDDERTLANCLAAGGDDFMTKPFSPVVMRAKIEALLRQRMLYNTVKTQRDELQRRDERMQQEQMVAKKVFDTMMSAGCLHVPTIRARMSSSSLFNGDIILAAAKPSGALHVMLGDLAGTGLSAAIGSLPVSEVFYSMTRKGFSIADIACEVNKKLKDRLPPDMSLAACLFEMDAVEQTLTVWNGGLPNGYLYSRDAMDVISIFPSRYPRLGTIDDVNFSRDLDVVNLQDGDCFVVMTDGVIGAVSPTDEIFGQRRVEDCLRYCYDPDRLAERIVEAVGRFRGNADDSVDDLSLLAVTADAQVQQLLASSTSPGTIMRDSSGAWRFMVEFAHDALRVVDPVPIVQQMLVDMLGDTHHARDISVVARELIANSLEHGLLRLDSALKSTPDGFASYFAERTARLQTLTEGWLRILVRHEPNAFGGTLYLEVEDSGAGFRRKTTETKNHNVASAKGIALIERIVDKFEYNDAGNKACVELTWRTVPTQAKK